MRRARKAPGSFNRGFSFTASHQSGFDPQRRTELLAEARRKRVAWVEEARGVDEGIHGARRRRENQAAENGRKAEGELERLFPSAVGFHDFLSGLAGDKEESPTGDLSAILDPFMVQDINIGDDKPIPAHGDGVDAYDVFLDKLRHPQAAEVVKSLQQFVTTFKARDTRNKRRGVGTDISGSENIDAAGAQMFTGGRFNAGNKAGATARSELGTALSPVGVPGELEGVAIVDSYSGSAGTDRGEGDTVTAATMSGMMHAFLGRVANQMRESTVWRRETEAQWEETRECLERVVMHKVFDPAYALVVDAKRDKSIAERLQSLSFLTEEHLGVPKIVDAEGVNVKWSDAEDELMKMSSMRCPGDMLRCMIKCTRIVASVLTGSQEAGVLPGADEFLPALILLVKKVNPPNIHSNLEFVQSFRDPSKLLSEAGYVLTQVVSAVCFLEEVDASVLSIAHGDFERGLKGLQETARVGLQAHQLQVKREEEHARQSHTNSATIPNISATSQNSSKNIATGMGITSIASLTVSPAGESPGSVPGTAILPQPEDSRKISPMEVRAARLAGQRSAHLLLASAHADDTVFTKNDSQEDRHHWVPDQPTGSTGGHIRTMSLDGARGKTLRDGMDRTTGVSKGRLLDLRFVGCTTSELRMSELPALLAEHQRLARLCEELLAERGEPLGLRRRRL